MVEWPNDWVLVYELSGCGFASSCKHLNIYFSNDMIRIKDLNPDLLKIDKKSYKNTGIYYIGYITIRGTNYINIYIEILYQPKKGWPKFSSPHFLSLLENFVTQGRPIILTDENLSFFWKFI